MSADDPRISPPEAPQAQADRAHSGIYLGTFRGIRFYIDYSWFLIAAIVVYALSNTLFPAILRERPPLVYLAMGVVAAGIFFFSILLHELGHSVISQRCGIPVPSITLLFIGGIAEIAREPDDAKSELKIAIAGPLVSLMLAALYKGLAWGFLQARFMEGALVFDWLAAVNTYLVIFNAIPGYPLDGGRVLRALLWMRNGKLRQATYITSSGAWNAIVFILIGIFLKNAAESGYSQALFKEVLDGVRVRDLMTCDPIAVPARLPLSLAVDDFFLTNHHVAFPVVDEDGQFRGLLRLEFLKSVPREQWPYVLSGEVAAQNDTAKFVVSADDTAASALRTLLVAGQGRLGVTRNGTGELVGILTRHDLLHYIRIHTELEEGG